MIILFPYYVIVVLILVLHKTYLPLLMTEETLVVAAVSSQGKNISQMQRMSTVSAASNVNSRHPSATGRREGEKVNYISGSQLHTEVKNLSWSAQAFTYLI